MNKEKTKILVKFVIYLFCVCFCMNISYAYTVKNVIKGTFANRNVITTYDIPQKFRCVVCNQIFFDYYDLEDHAIYNLGHGGNDTESAKKKNIGHNETEKISNALNSDEKIFIHSPFLSQNHEISYQINNGPTQVIPKSGTSTQVGTCGYENGVPYVIYNFKDTDTITVTQRLLDAPPTGVSTSALYPLAIISALGLGAYVKKKK